MNTNEEALSNIMDILKETCLKSFSDNKSKINDSLYRLELINKISIILEKDATNEVLAEVQNDLLNSLVFSLQGYYRQAYMCLRSSLELLLSFLYYFDNRYDFILWKHDRIDMTWNHLISSEKGALNQQFLNLVYGSNLNIESLKERIIQLYRLTSQYVHGKYAYMQKTITDKIEYSKNQAVQYLDIGEDIQQITILLLYIRFHDLLKINLDPNDVLSIQRDIKKYEVKENG